MEPIRHFHALAVFACKANRLYRIYVRPQELVFIWAGKGGEGMAGARAVSRRGGLHAILGKAVLTAVNPAKGNEARQAVLDRTPLEDLIGNHPHNVRAAVGEFSEVRIAPRSDGHARIYSDHGHQALLHLRHRTLGRYRLGITSVEDVRVALSELHRTFGAKCRVEIPWPEQALECGCPFCRFDR